MHNCYVHFWMVSLIVLLGLGGCNGSKSETAGFPVGQAQQDKANPKPEQDVGIPPDRLDAILREHYQGLGFIERYDYEKAAESFRKAHELAPNWIPGTINLAIALMHHNGARLDAEGMEVREQREALDLLNEVMVRDLRNPHARFCRGLIFDSMGLTRRAHAEFRAVVEVDPSDADAWYMLGSTVDVQQVRQSGERERGQSDGPEGNEQRSKEQIADFQKALECNPYLIAAHYKLSLASRMAGDRDGMKTHLDAWKQLEGGQGGIRSGDETARLYGVEGRYARVINPLVNQVTPSEPISLPRFELPTVLKIRLAEGERWVSSADFAGRLAVIGRARRASAPRWRRSTPTVMAAPICFCRPPSSGRKASAMPCS